MQTTRGGDGEDPFDIAAAGTGLRAITEFPPDDGRANFPLGVVIRGIHPFNANKRPESLLVVIEPSASLSRATAGGVGSFQEHRFDLFDDRRHRLLQLGEEERAIADTKPEPKHDRSMAQ